MDFQLLSDIVNIENIAVSSRIRQIKELNAQFGKGRWRKLKGVATVRLADGTISRVELHWYEANGIGKRLMKIKRYLNE